MPKSQVVDVLARAKALVAAGWTQGAMARDAKGIPVLHLEIGACCFCSAGAILHVVSVDCAGDDDLLAATLSLMRTVVGHWSLAGWNDSPERTAGDVAAAFDRAIELARAA